MRHAGRLVFMVVAAAVAARPRRSRTDRGSARRPSSRSATRRSPVRPAAGRATRTTERRASTRSARRPTGTRRRASRSRAATAPRRRRRTSAAASSAPTSPARARRPPPAGPARTRTSSRASTSTPTRRAASARRARCRPTRATHNVKAVVVMIGANNYGFADILQTCVHELAHVADVVEELLLRRLRHVLALHVGADRDGDGQRQGRAPARRAPRWRTPATRASQYKIIAQTYWSPIPRGAGIRYPGVGLHAPDDRRLRRLEPRRRLGQRHGRAAFNNTVRNGAAQAGLPNVAVLDLQNSLDGHRLCENTVGLLEEVGVSSWTIAGRGRPHGVGRADPHGHDDLRPVPAPGGRPRELLGPAGDAQLPAPGLQRRRRPRRQLRAQRDRADLARRAEDGAFAIAAGAAVCPQRGAADGAARAADDAFAIAAGAAPRASRRRSSQPAPPRDDVLRAGRPAPSRLVDAPRRRAWGVLVCRARGRGDDAADLPVARGRAGGLAGRRLPARRAARRRLPGPGVRAADEPAQRGRVQLLPHPADGPADDRRLRALGRARRVPRRGGGGVGGRGSRAHARRRGRAPPRGGRPRGGHGARPARRGDARRRAAAGGPARRRGARPARTSRSCSTRRRRGGAARRRRSTSAPAARRCSSSGAGADEAMRDARHASAWRPRSRRCCARRWTATGCRRRSSRRRRCGARTCSRPRCCGPSRTTCARR